VEQRAADTPDATLCNLCGTPVSHSDRAWRKDGHDILRCPRCGLLFRTDPPEAEALKSIYGTDYFKASPRDKGGRGYLDYLGEEREHRRNAHRRLRLLSDFTPRGRLLDVGCAAGFFLDEATHAGWDPQGVDISATMTEWARTHLGLPVLTTPFLTASLSGGYQAITMWDYIEHVVDPRKEFRRAAQLLVPGGILALSTGDADSLVARLSGSRWHLLTPSHHNYFFTRETLKHYLEEEGFEVIGAKYPWSSYSVAYLAHKSQTFGATTVLNRLRTALMRPPLGQLEVPFNLFDILTLVARRVR